MNRPDPDAIGKFMELVSPPPRVPVAEVVGFRPQKAEEEGELGKQEWLLRACGLLDYLHGGPVRKPLADVIGYGGAAFGGKSYGMLGLAAIAQHAFPGCQIAFFRRKYTELSGPGGAMMKAEEIFYGLGIRRDGGKHWHFPDTKSDFYFRHCEYEHTVFDYQSQDIDIMLIDEATHFTWFMINYLLTRNRVSGPSGILSPFAVLCSNPGNIGHAFYMQLFDLDKKVIGTGRR